MGADVGQPLLIFGHQFFFIELEPLAAHFGKSDGEAVLSVLIQGNGGTGTEVLKNITEKRIIDIGFAGDHGIVVVQHQTGIFQHEVPPLFYGHYSRVGEG